MRDPLSWSLPLGRIFGITIRIHVLFPLIALPMIIRAAADDKAAAGAWIDAAEIIGLLFFSVLLHEFGHCAGAYWMDGDASEVLLWPLGGLAYVEVPNTPRAHFVTALCGPLVNLLLCVVSAALLAVVADPGFRPPLHPIYAPIRPFEAAGSAVRLTTWAGETLTVTTPLVIHLARFFWVNWVLLLFNTVLVGFPMDMGRLFQAVLWKYMGYRQSMVYAVFAGFLTMFAVAVIALIYNELLLGCLALFIYVSCRQQLVMMEQDGGESVFGYDFSQGYTSLERDEPTAAPPKRKQSWWQRWQQQRTQKRLQREQEVRESEERRMDELLEKVQQFGLPALTDEERRFLKRVSDRYRNRH